MSYACHRGSTAAFQAPGPGRSGVRRRAAGAAQAEPRGDEVSAAPRGDAVASTVVSAASSWSDGVPCTIRSMCAPGGEVDMLVESTADMVDSPERGPALTDSHSMVQENITRGGCAARVASSRCTTTKIPSVVSTQRYGDPTTSMLWSVQPVVSEQAPLSGGSCPIGATRHPS